MKLFTVSLALACLLRLPQAGFPNLGPPGASDDPFCGKWKLNVEKSTFVGEKIKIQKLGGNRYKWTSGNTSNTISYDGIEQVSFGRTISMARVTDPEGRNSWRMVIKKNGSVISSMIHTLSDDGKTQTITGTDIKPDGTTSDFTAVWKKVRGGSGWSGTWETAELKFTSPSENDNEYDVEPYEGDGLTFTTPAYQEVLSMKFDGQDYEEKGPNVASGSTSSGQRLNARTLEITGKVNGEIMDHKTYEVSPDGKTLTLTIRATGQPKAQTIVYDKM